MFKKILSLGLLLALLLIAVGVGFSAPATAGKHKRACLDNFVTQAEYNSVSVNDPKWFVEDTFGTSGWFVPKKTMHKRTVSEFLVKGYSHCNGSVVRIIYEKLTVETTWRLYQKSII
jgi:hypothetical protein